MINHRTGRFTSSQIYKLCLLPKSAKNIFAAPGLTYIQEKRLEGKLGRQIDLDVYSRAMAWGNLMEKIVWMNYFDNYTLISNDYRFHPDLGDYWSGIPDMEFPGEIAEIKCYQMKKFAQYSDCLMSKNIEQLRNDFPQEYWQIVSNAIINDVPKGTAISYMPYRDELKDIIDAVENSGLLEQFEFNPWEFRWMVEEDLSNLCWIDKGGYFQNVTSFTFEVPKSDKEFLTERVKLAIEELKN